MNVWCVDWRHMNTAAPDYLEYTVINQKQYFHIKKYNDYNQTKKNVIH